LKYCSDRCRVAAHRGKIADPSFVTKVDPYLDQGGVNETPRRATSRTAAGHPGREYVAIYFQDECPKIGSGWRRVIVLSRGPKWVRVIEPGLKTRVRIETATFDRCRPRTLEPGRDYFPSKLAARLRHKSRAVDESSYAQAATAAWIHGFDPPPPSKPPLNTPWLRKFKAWLDRTPPGEMADLPDFLNRRADHDDEQEAA
jgi:hypothetical protein